jgi:SAM-dependent methyltransferase
LTEPTNMDRLLEATYRAEQRHFWFHGFRRFTTPLLEDATRALSSPRLLDCGCGTGANLPLLERFGHAFGFDFTWSGLAFGGREGRRRIFQATAAQIPVGDGQIDVVTSFDVLTVLPDAVERAAIREMFRVLKPGGSIVVNVAALELLRGHHAVLSGEARRYTRPLLRRKLEEAGFEVVRVGYTNLSVFPLMLAVRLGQRLSGLREAAVDMTVPPAPVNAALKGLLAIEATLARVLPMPIGSSVLCLARKPADRS